MRFYTHFRSLFLPILALVVVGMMPLPLFEPFYKSTTVEICDNAIDDDEDGFIDLNDPECECMVIEPTSLIPNPSFEDTHCCPQMQGELSCASGWIQASFPTTDFIHLCGWMGWDNEFDQFPPPQPFPDGEGIVGFRDGAITAATGADPIPFDAPNWKEYAGACLLSPMMADSAYRIEFEIGFVDQETSPPLEVTLFGTTDCANLPFGGNSIESLVGCPTNSPGWVKLGYIDVSGGNGNVWVKAAIDVVPEEDIKAVAIGPNCLNNLRETNRYYFLDNLLLDEKESFEFKITSLSHPCSDDFILQVNDISDVLYQWYKNGIALVGETAAQLTQMYGEGNYQVRIIDGLDCILTGIYPFEIPTLVNNIAQSICEGDVFPFGNEVLTEEGVYFDTLRSTVNNCDSVVILNLQIDNNTVDTINTTIFDGQTFEIEGHSYSDPGDYSITVTSPNGCETEIILQIDHYQVYIPNAFSPNDDGINDTFTILAENGLIQHVDLTIFNRWGGIVFNGDEWDGRDNEEFVNSGVYVYLIEITTNDNKSHQLSGSVTVLR